MGRSASPEGGPAHTLRAGYELSRLATHYDEHISSVAVDEYNGRIAIDDTTLAQRGGAGALYAEDAWAPNGALSVRPGVRFERVPAAAWQGVSPRLAVKLRARDDLAFTFATGRYAQWTHAVRNEDLPLQIVDIWLASDRQVPVSTGTELVGGTELWRGRSTLVRVEGYAKRFADLVEPPAALDPRLRPSELRRFGGTSRGVDVLVRRFGSASGAGAPGAATSGPATAAGRFGGWLAYSYAVSRRESQARNEQIRTARNADRYPGYERLDLSAHRLFRLGGLVGDAYVNVVNVFNNRNVLLYSFDTSETPPRVSGLSQLPFLPTVGARVGF